MVGCCYWLGGRSTYVAIVVMGTAAIAAIGPNSATSSRFEPYGKVEVGIKVKVEVKVQS